VKISVIVQRYGAEINGGAELHARYVAEHLSRHAEVEVLTTCARNYVTWANELTPGSEIVNDVPVHRFPVTRARDAHEFGQRSKRVFDRPHSIADELGWLASEGPTSPSLVQAVKDRADRTDWFVFFSYRYYHAFHGVRAVPSKSVLVPTAERDPAIGLSIFPSLFRSARALMFNSFEERSMIQHVAGGQRLPGAVVGVGSNLPERSEAERFRQKYGVTGPFAVYVGRIDENKGCAELFEYFRRFERAVPGRLQLILIGQSLLPIPPDPRIRHLGFLDDEDKFDAIAAAELLIMPSYYESLSMVALEAWGLGTPVLANGRCDVLRGQCLRSNAGLYYEGYAEFREALHAITASPWLRRTLGRNGLAYYRHHYSWPVIERKYLEVFDRLTRTAATETADEELPGLVARYRRTRPPAVEVLAGIPAGASRR
jgi:glycosyltransferase involved in cell wall biosynthesis